MSHSGRPPFRAALLLAAASALVIACGSVQEKGDAAADGGAGGSSGAAGTAGAGGMIGGAGMTGTGGAAGAAGAGGSAATGGHAGAGGSAGTGGSAGAGGVDGGSKCGMATCAANQSCCNSSCGICVATGGGCTSQVCGALNWYYTCGSSSICFKSDAGTQDGGSSLPSCAADQKADAPCPTLGQMCDPHDNTCGRVLFCGTEPLPCPL